MIRPYRHSGRVAVFVKKNYAGGHVFAGGMPGASLFRDKGVRKKMPKGLHKKDNQWFEPRS
jgi:hypothetical protein